MFLLTDGTVSGEVLPPVHADMRAVQSTLEVGCVCVYVFAPDVAVVTVPVPAATESVAECDFHSAGGLAIVGGEFGVFVGG